MTLSNLALRFSDSILGKASFVSCDLSLVLPVVCCEGSKRDFFSTSDKGQRTRDKGPSFSPVDPPQNHVDRANARDHVRDQAALEHLGQGLQVGERRGAHVAPKWFWRTVAHHVDPQL